MKNSILVDFDSEREHPILFSKPPDTELPATKEGAYKMVVDDVATLSYAIKQLIILTSDSNIKQMLVNGVIKTVNEALTYETDEPKENTEGSSSEETEQKV